METKTILLTAAIYLIAILPLHSQIDNLRNVRRAVQDRQTQSRDDSRTPLQSSNKLLNLVKFLSKYFMFPGQMEITETMAVKLPLSEIPTRP